MTTETREIQDLAQPYSRATVAERSRSQNEPAWLAEQRLAAWDAFEQMPMPTDRERAWKYLDPARLSLDGKLGAAADETEPSTGARSRADESFASAVQVDGGPVTTIGPASPDDQGVIVAPLALAAIQHGELVRRHLGRAVRPDDSKFTALNSALWDGGFFIYVPNDVTVAGPIHVTLEQRTDGLALFPRLLVVLGRNAKLTLNEERIGMGDQGAFVAGVTEFILADAAELSHYAVQRWGGRVQDVTTQRTLLANDAKSTTLTAGIGGAVQKWWVEAQMEGAGSESNMLGVFFGTGVQHFDVITKQNHIGPHTTSDLLYKAALKDRSVGAYYGLTWVGPEARGTAANQVDRNLLLSPKAKADADPVLEILTSDVIRCGHGASAGPVDQEQLFYLECRGLPRAEAEKLLVQGFLFEVLERIPVETVRASVEEAVSAKLGA